MESDQGLTEQVQTLTRQIAGSDASVHTQILAHKIAEAQIDLLRVRKARHRILSEELSNPDYLSPAIMGKKLKAVIHFTRAFGADMPLPAHLIEFVDSKPEGPFKLVTILLDNGYLSSKHLTAMSGALFRDASLQFERSTQSGG